MPMAVERWNSGVTGDDGLFVSLSVSNFQDGDAGVEVAEFADDQFEPSFHAREALVDLAEPDEHIRPKVCQSMVEIVQPSVDQKNAN
jgi:hypothetical protein